MKMNWSVLAICQGPESRHKAVRFCDELVSRFWDSYEISVSWFTHDELCDPGQYDRLSESAQRAKLIIVEASTSPIPPVVYNALQRCLNGRTQKEGLFAGICDAQANQLALRNLARRAGLDFISEVPAALESGMPDSVDYYTSRAHEVSHLLSDILRRPPASPPPLM